MHSRKPPLWLLLNLTGLIHWEPVESRLRGGLTAALKTLCLAQSPQPVVCICKKGKRGSQRSKVDKRKNLEAEVESKWAQRNAHLCQHCPELSHSLRDPLLPFLAASRSRRSMSPGFHHLIKRYAVGPVMFNEVIAR